MRAGKHHLYDEIELNSGNASTAGAARSTDKTKAKAQDGEEDYNFDEFN